MSILSGLEIIRQMKLGAIKITPFKRERVRSNSVDLTLSDMLLYYDNPVLDMRKPNPTHTIKIPPEGYMLQPGQLYLGATNEFTETHGFVPCIETRSIPRKTGAFYSSVSGIW